MGGIKITPADIAFSKCVRARTGWKCERCGAQHDENSKGLHCSHYHGRGKWSVRFDPNNAFAHCYGCHSYLGGRPVEFTDWVIERIGDGMAEIVNERANNTSLGRTAKREKSDIAKHYREQLKIIQEKREAGECGRIEFDGYF